jgi:hypothetical protein
MPLALPAAQTYVGTQPVDQPLPPTARVWSPESHNVAEQELNDPRLLATHLGCLS